MAHFNSACSSSGPGSQGISSVVIVSGKLVTKECFISRVHHSGDHHILSALASESLPTLRPRLLRSSPRTVLPRLSTNWRELQRKIAEWCVLWWLPRITNRFLLPRCVCVCVFAIVCRFEHLGTCINACSYYTEGQTWLVLLMLCLPGRCLP